MAFQPPDRSLRRKMSAKIEMKIQISMNQKKNATMDQITSQNPKVAVPTWLQAASRTVASASSRDDRSAEAAGAPFVECGHPFLLCGPGRPWAAAPDTNHVNVPMLILHGPDRVIRCG